MEATVKALVGFEADLDKAKADATEAKRRAIKDSLDWAESARAAALSTAQEAASKSLAEAREAAEKEASKIRKKGDSDMKAFESAISKHKSKAADLVAARLLGERK